jgi:hypothetical protein
VSLPSTVYTECSTETHDCENRFFFSELLLGRVTCCHLRCDFCAREFSNYGAVEQRFTIKVVQKQEKQCTCKVACGPFGSVLSLTRCHSRHFAWISSQRTRGLYKSVAIEMQQWILLCNFELYVSLLTI